MKLKRGLLAAICLLGVGGPLAAQAVPVATQRPGFSWPRFGAGVAVSIAGHELAHVVTAVALGGHPSLYFDAGRPVIHSGIDGVQHPTRCFTFSAAGMAVQLLADEVLLDWPRRDGGPGEFERGVLAGGVGTVMFYLTLGRNAAAGDVEQMHYYSGLSPWTITAIAGGLAASDLLRMVLKQQRPHFFAAPTRDGRLVVGLNGER